jgi:hypothetical protein
MDPLDPLIFLLKLCQPESFFVKNIEFLTTFTKKSSRGGEGRKNERVERVYDFK